MIREDKIGEQEVPTISIPVYCKKTTDYYNGVLKLFYIESHTNNTNQLKTLHHIIVMIFWLNDSGGTAVTGVSK